MCLFSLPEKMKQNLEALWDTQQFPGQHGQMYIALHTTWSKGEQLRNGLSLFSSADYPSDVGLRIRLVVFFGPLQKIIHFYAVESVESSFSFLFVGHIPTFNGPLATNQVTRSPWLQDKSDATGAALRNASKAWIQGGFVGKDGGF